MFKKSSIKILILTDSTKFIIRISRQSDLRPLASPKQYFLNNKIPNFIFFLTLHCKSLQIVKTTQTFRLSQVYREFWTYKNPDIAKLSWELGFVAFPKPYFLAFTNIFQVFGPRKC